MAQITVPSTLVAQVRSGTHTTLGLSAQGIAEASERPDRETNPSCFAEPLQRFDGARGLLNAIGWHPTAGAVHVDAGYTPALIEALREAMGVDPEDGDLAGYAYSLARWVAERGTIGGA